MVFSIALTGEGSKLLASRFGRFTGYLVGWLGLYAAWPFLAGVYLPSTEVVTAVGPALAHPYLFPWQAPYGVIWYAVNEWTWHVGNFLSMPYGLGWMTVLMFLNVPFLYMFRNSELLTAYFMTSFFLWAVLPWDLSILWLVVIGFLGSSFLPRLVGPLLGVIAKVPVGAPLSVWQYDFLNGQEGGRVGSAFVPGHLMPYAVLAAWCIAVMLKPYIRFLSLDSYRVPLETLSRRQDNTEGGSDSTRLETGGEVETVS